MAVTGIGSFGVKYYIVLTDWFLWKCIMSWMPTGVCNALYGVPVEES